MGDCKTKFYSFDQIKIDTFRPSVDINTNYTKFQIFTTLTVQSGRLVPNETVSEGLVPMS